MTKHLWLIWLPLLFLPNAGAERPTPFGTLSVADFLVGPYILFAYWRVRRNHTVHVKAYIDVLAPLLFFFLAWILFVSATIPLRYLYFGNDRVIFSLLKVGKFSLYAVAGLLTCRALAVSTNGERRAFYWSLLACGTLVGTTLLLSQNSLGLLLPGQSVSGREEVYQSNVVSAMMAMFVTFVAGTVLAKGVTPRWRKVALIALAVMLLGFLMARGRGGWVAALIGMLYLFAHVDLRRTLLVALLGAAVVGYAYTQYPTFRTEVDRTLNPDPIYLQTYDAGVMGIDDGARWVILRAETPKILNAPLFGRGFFHRGGVSGIYPTGSHNFFLQMFLEAGIPGGLLMLLFFRRMWQHTSAQHVGAELALPVHAALLAAGVVGLSGEYFYGGTALLTLFLIYAPVGSLPVNATASHAPILHRRRLPARRISLRGDFRHASHLTK